MSSLVIPILNGDALGDQFPKNLPGKTLVFLIKKYYRFLKTLILSRSGKQPDIGSHIGSHLKS